jgi:tetratricopeptide (TPR) repeat protein
MPKCCFVVMGFGEKTDYKTSRVLDLDKTYKHIIKKAVEEAGLVCIRADEIPHSGTIDVPMYEQLLDADLVIADLSASNLNAVYELGIRHALKPYTTIVIAEDQFASPFDVNHILIRTYRHDGKALDIDVVEKFRAELKDAIQAIMSNSKIDSPVYTFLPLTPPARGAAPPAPSAPAPAAGEAAGQQTSLAALMEGVREAKRDKDFPTAIALLKSARKIAPNDAFVAQQLALCTYKSKRPDEAKALDDARTILVELDPLHSNNAETLGLWGAIHKRMFALSKDRKALDAAVFAYEKGYRLLADYYNGINWAFLLNVRAAVSEPADAIADFVLARRTREDVLKICKEKFDALKDSEETREERYWLLATMAEAAVGIGDEASSAQHLDQAAKIATGTWMADSTNEQLPALRAYLADSPLKLIKT